MKVHPVINIEYLKVYHTSPERLGPRTKGAQIIWSKELLNGREVESVKTIGRLGMERSSTLYTGRTLQSMMTPRNPVHQ
jgi:hypothetical protein